MESAKRNLISLLRWSEKYTKTDMVYLFHGGFWLGLAQMISALVGFVLVIIFANLLNTEILGEYRFLMSAFLILSIFALPGIRNSLLESIPKGFLGNLPVAFKATFQWGLIGSLASLICASYYLLQGNTSLTLGFVVIAAALPFFDSSTLYLEHLKSIKDFKKIFTYTLITRIIFFTVSIIAVLIYPNYAWLILAGFMLGNIIPNLFFQKKVESTKDVQNGKSDTGLIRYAGHLSVMSALGLLGSQIDKILVWNTLGADQLAIFYIAFAIPQEILRFLSITPGLIFPKLSKARSEDIKKTLLPKIWKYFFIICVIALAYIILCPFIFQFIFPQYLGAVKYSQIITLSILSTAFIPIAIYLTAHKKTKSLYIFSTTVPLTRIISSLVLIPTLGLIGAVYAIIIESVFGIIMLVYLFKK